MTIPMAMLTDTTRCVGCEKCVEACKKENGLDAECMTMNPVRKGTAMMSGKA